MEINKIICGDSQEVLKTFPDNFFDAIITDPPAGISFMNKSWDTFNKSEFGIKGNEGANDLKVKKNFEILPRYTNYSRDNFIQYMTAIMTEANRTLKSGGHALVWAIPRTSHWTATALEDAGFEIRDIVHHLFGSGFPKSLDIGKKVDEIQGNERTYIGKKLTPNGQKYPEGYDKNSELFSRSNSDLTIGNSEWEGWGTSLKPAVEHWILCRKPITENTIAENVLKFGTGGLNVDACRIPYQNNKDKNSAINIRPNQYETLKFFGSNTKFKMGEERNLLIGRFPANLILGDEDILGDKSRFFYCAKPSKTEKDAGCEDLEIKNTGSLNFRQDGSLDGQIPQGKNNHPTVKSLELMKYLIKLITPPNGVILDPFAGSGSTLVAAKELGFGFVGIEQNAEYVEIANKRLNSERIIKIVENRNKKGLFDF